MSRTKDLLYERQGFAELFSALQEAESRLDVSVFAETLLKGGARSREISVRLLECFTEIIRCNLPFFLTCENDELRNRALQVAQIYEQEVTSNA